MRETDGILFDLDRDPLGCGGGYLPGMEPGLSGVRAPARADCAPAPGLHGPADGGDRRPHPAQIGDGGARMAVMEVCYRHQLDELAAHGGTLYPGVPETLRALSQRFPLCIVSNCQDGYIQCFLKVHGLEDCIRDFECPGRTGCGKAENIRLVAGRNGLKCPVYVGDTQGDADAARAAGVPFFHAAYGFGAVEAAEARLNGIGELTGLLTPP